MQREVENARPCRVRFPPDEDFAIVAGRGEDVAVFGVGPRNAPNCAFVTRGGLETLKKRREGTENEESVRENILTNYGVAYPFNVSVNLCVSPSTSNIFTVRSEEQVARRRP